MRTEFEDIERPGRQRASGLRAQKVQHWDCWTTGSAMAELRRAQGWRHNIPVVRPKKLRNVRGCGDCHGLSGGQVFGELDTHQQAPDHCQIPTSKRVPQSRLDELFSTVKHLQFVVASHDDCIVHLEKESLSLRSSLSQQAQQIDLLEIHSLPSNLIMYGLAESYSETTASVERRDVDEVVSVNQPYQDTSFYSETVFIQFCREKLNFEFHPDDIVNCHCLQKYTQSIHHFMVIDFASRRV